MLLHQLLSRLLYDGLKGDLERRWHLPLGGAQPLVLRHLLLVVPSKELGAGLAKLLEGLLHFLFLGLALDAR